MTQTHDLDAAIKDIFKQVFEVQPEQLDDQTGWGDLERWDSLGHLQLLDAVQARFQIVIPPEQALEMGTIQDIKRVIMTLQVDDVLDQHES